MFKKEIQKRYLEIEILKLVDKYRKNESVDCIYFVPFKDEGKNIYELSVVFSDRNELEKCKKEMKNYRVLVKTVGGRFKLRLNDNANYCGCAMHPKEMRLVKDLLSSTILFDRNGEYEKIAHQFDRYGTSSTWGNIVDLGLDLPVQKKIGEK